MNPKQTGIATALAVAVVAVIFIFPGLSPWKSTAATATTTPQDNTQAAAAGDSQITQVSSSTGQLSMPTENGTGSSASQTITTADGLQITDESVGQGPAAAAGDTVTVQYVGSLTNGTVFDASANHGSQGFTFPLGAHQVIAGWDEGVVGMKVGGKRKLVIPPSLGYGAAGAGGVIPPNATLVFEVEVVKIQKNTPYTNH
ncbi:MAG: FKBP-type peptidyl-prolyl cis-trans isomerase [Minisyncoccia bacterium]